jgi:hypothetical protein
MIRGAFVLIAGAVMRLSLSGGGLRVRLTSIHPHLHAHPINLYAKNSHDNQITLMMVKKQHFQFIF